MRTFGIEIEVTGFGTNDNHSFARECQNQGLTVNVESYNHTNRRNWKVVTDSTCGWEVVSPKLRNFDSLKTITEALNVVGAKVSRRCGLHVHFDAGDFHLVDWQRLLKLYARYEVALDSVVPSSRRENSNVFCRSVKGNLSLPALFNHIDGAFDLDDLSALYSGFHGMMNRRYFKVNLQSFWRHGTVEIRHHGGTMDFEKISNWVKLMQGIIAKAKDHSFQIKKSSASIDDMLAEVFGNVSPTVVREVAAEANLMEARSRRPGFGRDCPVWADGVELFNSFVNSGVNVLDRDVRESLIQSLINTHGCTRDKAARIYRWNKKAYLARQDDFQNSQVVEVSNPAHADRNSVMDFFRARASHFGFTVAVAA